MKLIFGVMLALVLGAGAWGKDEPTMTADAAGAEWIASSNFNRRTTEAVNYLVLHSTCMATNDIEECIRLFQKRESQVSSHYIVAKDGRIVQMVRETDRAWHAGLTDWRGISDMNSCSIGIEMAHRDQDERDDWPDAQMAAVAHLLADIRLRHRIPNDQVVFHSEVAAPKGRKTDPRDFDRSRLLRMAAGLEP